MSDEHHSKPRKRADEVRFRQGLFPEAALSGAEQREHSHADEESNSARSGSRSDLRAGPSTGYCNPPVETRFAKGQSGNPKGRPRKSTTPHATSPAATDFDALIEDYFLKPMRMRDGQETKEVPRAVAYLKVLEKQASEGKVTATRLLMQKAESASRARQARLEENAKFWREYIETFPARERRAHEAGRPLPEWFPRPEDIMIRPDREVIIAGPLDEASWRECCTLRDIRDALHLWILYEAERTEKSPRDPGAISIAQFIVGQIEPRLPRRWRLNTPDFDQRMFRFAIMSRSRQKAELKQVFEKIGCPAPPERPIPEVPDQLLRAFGFSPKQLRATIAAIRSKKTA